ncbi:MAG TPA: rhodanese-like domain-containing protein [Steroidobacteraceae bacterium]|nr:rhodanese-like domain-containing protein [Steroidobacteraceae bacterium]
MQRLLEYVGHHYYLAGGAVLAAIALLLYEVRARAQSFAALSTAQAVRLMNQGALVIDLRERSAFEAGHIGDARSVPAAQLESEAQSLKKWKAKPVIAYDEGGLKGAAAVRTLKGLGFTEVFNLEGGLNAWVKENLPLSKGTGGKGSGK